MSPRRGEHSARELKKLERQFAELRGQTKKAKEPLLKEVSRGPRPAPRWPLEEARAAERAWGKHGTEGQNRDPGRYT